MEQPQRREADRAPADQRHDASPVADERATGQPSVDPDGDGWGSMDRERSYDTGGCWAPRDAQVPVSVESNKRWPTSCVSFARRLAVVDP